MGVGPLMGRIHIPDPIADRFIDLQVQIDCQRDEIKNIKSGFPGVLQFRMNDTRGKQPRNNQKSIMSLIVS